MIQYLTTFDYYPHNTSEMAERSRNICGKIKAGREISIRHRIDVMIASGNNDIRLFFNNNVTLVPVPRSSPITGDAVWPALVICNILLDRGLAKDISNLLVRSTPLRKASLQPNADSRPSVKEHYESFSINRGLYNPTQITLVDDVLTQGRTTYACFQRLEETFPEIEIRVFAIAKSKSFETGPIEDVFNITFGQISYNPRSGKTTAYS